jgi:hypothetical protein
MWIVSCRAMLFIGLALVLPAGAYAADAWIGVWTLNHAKSTGTYAEEIPLNSTLIFRVNPNQEVTLIETGRDSSRHSMARDSIFLYNGHDATVHGGAQGPAGPLAKPPRDAPTALRPGQPLMGQLGGSIAYDTISFLRTGVNSLRAVVKDHGRFVGTHSYVVSGQGHTMTLTEDDMTVYGQKVHTVLVYQK